MEYKKAKDLLPDSLVNAIQEYTEGCLIYIPNKPGLRRGWGESTGTKAMLHNRNTNIIYDFQSGMSVIKIALKYNLAENTVMKIVYKR